MSQKILRKVAAPMTLAAALGAGAVTASADTNTENLNTANDFISKLSRTAELNATLTAEYDAAVEAAVAGNVEAVLKYEADFAGHVRLMSDLSESEQSRLMDMFLRNKRRLWTFIEESEAYINKTVEEVGGYEDKFNAAVDANARAIADYTSSATDVANANKSAVDAYAAAVATTVENNRRVDEEYTTKLAEFDRQMSDRDEVARVNAEIEKRNNEKRARFEAEKRVISEVKAKLGEHAGASANSRQEALDHNAAVERRNEEKRLDYERKLDAWQKSATNATSDVTVEGEKLFEDDKMVITRAGADDNFRRYKTYVKDPSLGVPIGGWHFTEHGGFDRVRGENKIGLAMDSTITTDGVELKMMVSSYDQTLGPDQPRVFTRRSSSALDNEVSVDFYDNVPVSYRWANRLRQETNVGYQFDLGVASHGDDSLVRLKITPHADGKILGIDGSQYHRTEKQADGSWIVEYRTPPKKSVTVNLGSTSATKTAATYKDTFVSMFGYGAGFDITVLESSYSDSIGSTAVRVTGPGQGPENGGDARFMHTDVSNAFETNTYVDARPKAKSVTPPPMPPTYEPLRPVPAAVIELNLDNPVEPEYETVTPLGAPPVRLVRGAYTPLPVAPLIRQLPNAPVFTSLPSAPKLTAKMPEIPVMEGPTASVLDFSRLKLPTQPTLTKLPSLSLRKFDTKVPEFKTPTKTASATGLTVRGLNSTDGLRELIRRISNR